MKGITKIMLVVGAGLAFWYIPTILALKNLQISLFSFIPTGIHETSIDAIIGVKLKNTSSTRIDLSWIKADVLFNGVKIAQFNQAENFIILPGLEQNFNVNFTIDAQIIGTKMFTELIAQNLQNFIVSVNGTLNANNKVLPFETLFTIKDITA